MENDVCTMPRVIWMGKDSIGEMRVVQLAGVQMKPERLLGPDAMGNPGGWSEVEWEDSHDSLLAGEYLRILQAKAERQSQGVLVQCGLCGAKTYVPGGGPYQCPLPGCAGVCCAEFLKDEGG